ncbi:MAG: hypothetical protein U0350_09080 [Caldilineaceae bacterium]
MDTNWVEPVATQVWFDARSRLLCVEMNGIIERIDFDQIPEEDFETTAPLIKFELGCQGSVVVCHHHGGQETWSPVDMWLPGGFTPFGKNDN